jgi:hypothetical protein
MQEFILASLYQAAHRLRFLHYATLIQATVLQFTSNLVYQTAHRLRFLHYATLIQATVLQFTSNLVYHAAHRLRFLHYAALIQATVHYSFSLTGLNYSAASFFPSSVFDSPNFSFNRATASGSYCLGVLCLTTTAAVRVGWAGVS